jgi:hypothetical protein
VEAGLFDLEQVADACSTADSTCEYKRTHAVTLKRWLETNASIGIPSTYSSTKYGWPAALRPASNNFAIPVCVRLASSDPSR